MKFIVTTFFKGGFYILSNSAFRRFVWLVVRHGHRQRYKPANVRAGKFKLRVPDARSFIWQFYEIFFKEIYRFKTSSSAPVIIDCGSNVGSSVLFYKTAYPSSTVLAFEPDPSIFEYLKNNLTANGIDSGVTLFQQAVWKADEVLNFASEGADGGALNDAGQSAISVDAVRLKTILEKYERVDFLKIDIEGAEVTVLQDCQDALDRVVNLFVEYHSFNNGPQELQVILDILSRKGYRYYVENVTHKMSPLVSDKQYGNNMDMQLNVFAYRA